ncbi:gluconate transport inducer 1/Pac2, partial [Syncephalis pseudoplumigaleata]
METYYGYVETVLDALLLFEACDRGMLTCVKRRLLGEERDHIRSGSVYIWDEDNSGIQRWTDGHRWSSSRPCGNFIVYDELDNYKRRSDPPKVEHPPADGTSADDSSALKPGAARRNVLSDGLVKRALSVCTADGRRLHLVSYYTKADVQRRALNIPRCDAAFAAIKIPESKFPEI